MLPTTSTRESTPPPGRPYEPEFRAAQRGRVLLEWIEKGERQNCADDGWVRIDGPWVHLYSDEMEHWQTWPAHNVIAVDWETLDA